ncbi:MAG: protein O-mannosyl-transferase family [Ignavibacteria bacterium]
MKKIPVKILFGIVAFVISFSLYLFTLCPTIGFIDSGELTTVCVKLGIAHPTGYPLFTILGNIFSYLPFGEYAYRLNLMNAFISSLAVSLLFYLIRYILDVSTILFAKEKHQKPQVNELELSLISLFAVMFFAYSTTFWDIANSLEVYSLHAIFLSANILFFLKAFEVDESEFLSDRWGEKWWLIFAYVLGLSFTNHLTTIFLSLGFLYLYFVTYKFNSFSFRRILLMSLPFIAGLSVYIYFPIRADNPYISWGHPDNLTNIIRHVSAKQFSVWMFSSSEVTARQFKHFLDFYPKAVKYLPVLLAAIGVIRLFSLNKKLSYFTILLFGFNILYAINYDIHDIDSYFLLAFIITSIWAAFGIKLIIEKFQRHKVFLFAIIGVFVILEAAMNFKESDESKNYFVRDFTMNAFKSADENSIVISTLWDFWVSASFYYQKVYHMRPDLIVLDKELMRRTWYIDQLKRQYPDLYSRSASEFDAYYNELVKFENQTSRYTNPKNEADKLEVMKINTAFITLLNSIVDQNYPDRKIYVTFEVEDNKVERFANTYSRIPEGLLLKLSKNKNLIDDYRNVPPFEYTITQKTDYYHKFIMDAYYMTSLARANYLMNISKFDEAEQLINKALEIRPNDKQALGLLNKLHQLKALPN